MTSSWMILLGIEALSIASLLLGVVLYRYILASHRTFIDSLQHTEKQAHKERMGVLVWFYIISTFIITLVVTVVLIHISPLS